MVRRPDGQQGMRFRRLYSGPAIYARACCVLQWTA